MLVLNLIDKYDNNFLANITKAQHSLHHLQPPVRLMTIVSESVATFIPYRISTHRRSFVIIRSLHELI